MVSSVTMLPRKRYRPNPAAVSSTSLPTTALSPETSLSQASSTSGQTASDQQKPPPSPSNLDNTPLSASSRVKEVRKTSSWYGSWPRPPKASASTSVAKENILGGTVKSNGHSDLSRFDPKKSDDAASVYSQTLSTTAHLNESSSTLNGSAPQSKSNLDKDLPSATHENTTAQEPKAHPEPLPILERSSTTGPVEAPNTERPVEAQAQPDSTQNKDEASSQGEVEQEPRITQKQISSAGWLGWWYNNAANEPTTPRLVVTHESPKQEEAAVPGTPPQDSASSPDDPSPKPAAEVSQNPTSWFGFWPSTSQPKMKFGDNGATDSAGKSLPLKEEGSVKDGASPKDSHAVNQTSTESAGPDADVSNSSPDVDMKDAPEPLPQVQSPPPKAGSTWAFWSRETPTAKGQTNAQESGQIAVIGEGSEARPSPMAAGDVSEAPAKEQKAEPVVKTAQPGGVSVWRRTKRLRPLSMEVDVTRPSSAGSTASAPEHDQIAKSSQITEQTAPQAKEPVKADAAKKASLESTKKSTAESETSVKEPPNLLLPSFASTYQMKENSSILRQITNLVLRTSNPPPNHVFRVKDTPKIHKAIAIGIHGLFPATYLRPMIGQPTGTSLRFANLGADAIRRWADSHGCPDCEIEKVALEGEGRINERVDNLWKLMLNWVEQLRKADLIIIACHSQGVPVSIMLLEKLIDLGIVSSARIGVCAMAGVALGPFPDYKSSILMGSAAELWEFGNPQSSNSKRFEACLKRVVDFGARITFIGSIDDQLVPMESAVYSPANHPYIFRAVFIDGRVHAPDFISHLVGFALKLRNLGVSDHGLVRELSIALAGSLYSGEGHSRLYYDAAVYDLAITHALETTDTAKSTPCVIPSRETASLASPNPYVLPWIMRGFLEEDFVKTQLSAETDELLRQFDDWKPTNKALKDVKYRLEAVRSKL